MPTEGSGRTSVARRPSSYDFARDTLTPLLEAFEAHYDAWDSGLVEPRDAVDFSAVWRSARVEKGITWLKYHKGPEFAKDFDSTIIKAIRTYDKLWFRASCIADGWRPESPLPKEGSLDRFAFHHAYVRLQNDLKFAGRPVPEDLARQRLFDFDRRCTLAKRRFWQCVEFLSDLRNIIGDAATQQTVRDWFGDTTDGESANSCKPDARMIPKEAGYYEFRRSGNRWEVHFPGDQGGSFDDRKGMAYIHAILCWGKRTASKSGLSIKLDSGTLRESTGATDEDEEAPASGERGHEVSDRFSIDQYRDSLRHAKQRAAAEGDPSKAAQYLEDADEIERHLRKITGKGGEARQSTSRAEKDAKSVQVEISRAIKALAERCPGLVAYLEPVRREKEQIWFEPTKHHDWQLF